MTLMKRVACIVLLLAAAPLCAQATRNDGPTPARARIDFKVIIPAVAYYEVRNDGLPHVQSNLRGWQIRREDLPQMRRYTLTHP